MKFSKDEATADLSVTSNNQPASSSRRKMMKTGAAISVLDAGFHDMEESVYLADLVLLTKRPTRVAEILHYGDARPRTVETLSRPSFVHTKKRSMEIFQREVRK